MNSSRLAKLVNSLCGWHTIKKLMKENPGKILITSDMGIGDRVFMLAYLNAWSDYYKIDTWGILVVNPDDPLYQCFSVSRDRLISVSKRKHKQICEFYSSVFGNRFRRQHQEILYANALAYFRGNRLLVNPCAFLFSTLTKAVYRIPQDTVPPKCIKKKKSDLLERLRDENGINFAQTILVNPYACSCNQTPIFFFQNIVDKLIQEGFSILCSTVGDQKPLAGSLGIYFPIDEAFALCESCRAVIGARSGFMDLMAFSNANIICIDNHDYQYSDLFRLEDNWPMNPHIRTFYYETRDVESKIKEIVDYVCEMEGEDVDNETIYKKDKKEIRPH